MTYQQRGRRRTRQNRIGASPRFGQRGYWGYMGNSPVGMHPVSPPLVGVHRGGGIIDPEAEDDVDLGLADLVDATRQLDQEEENWSSRQPNMDRESRVDFRTCKPQVQSDDLRVKQMQKYPCRFYEDLKLLCLPSGLVSRMLNTPAPRLADRSSTPAPGGYQDDMFTDLTEEEREKYECLICYHVLRDPRECTNKHLFCATCIYKWSVSQSDGRASCPMCRTYGRYRPNLEIDRILLQKHVKCPNLGCLWNGKLQDYKAHKKSHTEDKLTDPVHVPEDRPVRGVVNTMLGRNGVGSWRNRSVDSALDGIHDQGELSHRGVSTHTVEEAGGRLQNTMGRIQRGRERIQNMLDQVRTEMDQHRRRVEEFQEERERRRRETLHDVNNIGDQLSEVATGLMGLLDEMRLDSNRCNQYIRALRRGDGLPEIASSMRGAGRRRTRGSRSLPASSTSVEGSSQPARRQHQGRRQRTQASDGSTVSHNAMLPELAVGNTSTAQSGTGSISQGATSRRRRPQYDDSRL